MNDKIKAALAKVATRLQALSQEEFQGKLRLHSEGELASALLENYTLASFHAVLNFNQFCMKISQTAFLEQEVQNYELQSSKEAANDETYLMAA